jgi:hypothetical protein
LALDLRFAGWEQVKLLCHDWKIKQMAFDFKISLVDDEASDACATFVNDESDLYVMLVQAYFDESHQHSEAMPASAVSAVVGTGLQWTQFTQLWLGVLRHYDVTDTKGRHVFHTSEFESPEGRIGTVYEHWSKEKCDSFHRDLLHAIRFSGIRCFAAAVLAAEYEQVASKRSVVVLPDQTLESDRATLFGNKFFFCAYWAMTYAADEAKLYYPKGTRVAYYFESCSGSDKYQQPIDLMYDMAVTDAA